MDKNISLSTLQRPFHISSIEVKAPFACLVYSNQNDVTGDEMTSLATWLISSGCRYVVCAGKDCEAWHDKVDDVYIINYSVSNELVMTTWNENETLEEVVWFWLNLTNFDNITFENYLVLVIDNSKAIKEEIQKVIENSNL